MPTVDWERIRAEYIAGGISYRKLADKYDVPIDTIKKRAGREGWKKDCDKVAPELHRKTVQKMVQRVSTECADNAAIAQRIRAKLLKKLESEIDALPDNIGSESAKEISRTEIGSGKRESIYKRWRLRDLTAAYKDLTADMDMNCDAYDDKLKRARDLLGGVPDALDG